RSGEHLVEHCAKTKEIAPLIHALRLGLLWRHIRNRPSNLSYSRLKGTNRRFHVFRLRSSTFDEFRKAKVQQLYYPAGRDNDVRWLEITMNNAYAMCRLKTACNLNGQLKRLCHVEAPTGDV